MSSFLEDLKLFLQGNTNSVSLINDLVLIILLFADDMAIFGNNPEDLQNNLNLLHDYCNIWRLEVNGDKTKIMVFRKKGLKIEEKWTNNGLSVEVVDSFNYLGTVFKYNVNFALNNNFIIGKSLKALNV